MLATIRLYLRIFIVSWTGIFAVSYTHLDVYKRQPLLCPRYLLCQLSAPRGLFVTLVPWSPYNCTHSTLLSIIVSLPLLVYIIPRINVRDVMHFRCSEPLPHCRVRLAFSHISHFAVVKHYSFYYGAVNIVTTVSLIVVLFSGNRITDTYEVANYKL